MNLDNSHCAQVEFQLKEIIAENNQLKAKNQTMLSFLVDCINNWDCDRHAHNNGFPCRLCDVKKLLDTLDTSPGIPDNSNEKQFLDCGMNNQLAWRLGEIASDAGDPERDVGDHIDRGLILLRLLNESGFQVTGKI